MLASGIVAPYAGLHRCADDGPQRYASVSLAGSAFIYSTLGAAYRVTDWLRIGTTVTDVVSKVVARLVLSGCPGRTVCAPEDPDFDALAQDTQTDYITPSGSIGLQYDVARSATLGLALQAPSRVSATGTFAARVPKSAFFEGARRVGRVGTVIHAPPAAIRVRFPIREQPGEVMVNAGSYRRRYLLAGLRFARAL